MFDFTVTVDEGRIRQMEWAFRSWPQAVSRILKESINRTANQCRTRFTRAVREIVKIKAGVVRKAVKVIPASLSKLQATVSLGGRLYAGQAGITRGTMAEKLILASRPQSVWLFYNVFKKKYGDAAVFSWSYTIRRQVESGHGWTLGGKFFAAPDDSFVAKGRGDQTWIFQKQDSGKLSALKGPSVAEVVESAPGVMARIKAETFAGLEKNIDQRMTRFLEMMKRRAAA